MNLLIVDDHLGNLALLRALLEAEGHTVLEAPDGVEALRMLASAAVDVVISDALMPNMDGFQLCLEIRRSQRHRRLPFVMYTSTYNSASDRKLARDVGANRYLVKPASVAALRETIAGAVADAARSGDDLPVPPAEVSVLKQYNAVLVTKLEEKNAELLSVNESLRANADRFLGTLDRMLEGCQIIGHDWRYLYLNDRAASHGRRRKEELIGRTMMECYPGFEQTETFATLKRCMTERLSMRLETEFAVDGEAPGAFELSVQPVPEGLFILSLDITERKAAARKIQEQLDELLRWQEVMLDREDRVQALKAEVNDLLAQQNRPPRYEEPKR